MYTTNETIFRIVFGILWLVYLFVRLYFQGKARQVGGYIRFNEKQESFFFRLFAIAFFVLLLYCLTPWVDFAHLPFPLWLRWVGAAVTCAGTALFVWAHYALGKNWTAVLALSEQQKLVTDGPYRFVRHPMYSAFFTISIGYLFLSANWLISAVYLGTLIAMVAARIGREEEMMVGRFGEAYSRYMQQTGRILPRLWK